MKGYKEVTERKSKKKLGSKLSLNFRFKNLEVGYFFPGAFSLGRLKIPLPEIVINSHWIYHGSAVSKIPR